MKQIFAHVVEDIVSAVFECYIGESLNKDTVYKIQTDLRNRFKVMFDKIGNPISPVAAEWLADEHLKLAAPNGKTPICKLMTFDNAINVNALSSQDIHTLKTLFRPEVSLIASNLP